MARLRAAELVLKTPQSGECLLGGTSAGAGHSCNWTRRSIAWTASRPDDRPRAGRPWLGREAPWPWGCASSGKTGRRGSLAGRSRESAWGFARRWQPASTTASRWRKRTSSITICGRPLHVQGGSGPHARVVGLVLAGPPMMRSWRGFFQRPRSRSWPWPTRSTSGHQVLGDVPPADPRKYAGYDAWLSRSLDASQSERAASAASSACSTTANGTASGA